MTIVYFKNCSGNIETKTAIAFLNDPLLIRRWRKSSVNFILSKFTDLSFEAAIAPYREDKKRSRFIFINWQQVALSRPTINIYLFQFRVLLKVRPGRTHLIFEK